MLITTDGIVLKQRKIANNRRMLVIFTRTYGKLSVGTNMSERSRSKSALVLRPFTYAEYGIFKSRGYYNLNGGNVKQSFYSIGEDIDRFMIASKMIEYLDAVLAEEQVSTALFDLTLEFLTELTSAKSNYTTMLYAYIIKSLRMHGVMPEITRCADCGKKLDDIRQEDSGYAHFSVSAGGILCRECATREKSIPDTLIFRPGFDIVDVLNYFLGNDLSVFGRVALRPEVAKELNDILSGYLDMYLDIRLDVLSDELTI